MASSHKFAQLMTWIRRYGASLSELCLRGTDCNGAVLGALLSHQSALLKVCLRPNHPYEMYQVAAFNCITDLTICTSLSINLQPLRALLSLNSLHPNEESNVRCKVQSSR